MGMILLSFLGILLCAATCLASLSYAVSYKHKQSLSEESASAQSILKEHIGGLNAHDMGARASGALNIAKSSYEKTMTRIKGQEYSDSFGKIWFNIKDFFANFGSRVQQIINYLVSLSKPIAEDVVLDTDKEAEVEEVSDNPAQQVSSNAQEEELEKVVEKVTAKNAPKQNIHDESAQISPAQSSQVSSKEEDEENELFEKLESRLLNKLKENGMGNFDLWLQLGDLYLKHKDKDKAQEVFAMILKSSEGHYKELARDRLIGLS